MLNETSLIKEQEMRMRAQENKENHRGGGWRQESGGRPILLGPPPMMNNDTGMDGGGMGALSRPNEAAQGRSPHKNDLPLADQQLLDTIDGDPTKSLPIDEFPRMIRYGSISIFYLCIMNLLSLSTSQFETFNPKALLLQN